MIKINWARVIIGGLVATVILFVTDGFLHERILSADWQAVYHALGATPPQHNPAALLYFVVFELGRGLISIYLYALMRSCCGPGPKTAALAGVVAWIGPRNVVGMLRYDQRREGTLQVGDRAPDVTLVALDGKTPVRIADAIGDRPLVLIFGSFT